MSICHDKIKCYVRLSKIYIISFAILQIAQASNKQMSEFTQGVLVALIPALIVSIITAYLTVKLSMRQFYSQRLWDRKAELYSLIIENLTNFEYSFNEWLKNFPTGGELAVTDQKRLSEDYRKAKEFITKIAPIARYIISDDAIDAISEILSEFKDYEPNLGWYEYLYLSRHHRILKECIIDIVKYREEDLKIK